MLNPPALLDNATTVYAKTVVGGACTFIGKAHRVGCLPTKGVNVISNVRVGRADGKQAVDIYLPERADLLERTGAGDAGLPWVFFIHGGGWFTGSRKMGAVIGRLFAKQGMAVVSAGYRLAPKFGIKDQLEDIQNALEFVQTQSNRWRLDKSCFALVGESAGAHLMFRLAQAYPDNMSIPRALVGYYGIYDFKSWSKTKGIANKATVGLILSRLRKSNERVDLYDHQHAHRALPWQDVPVLLLHGDNDFVSPLDQSNQMLALLKDKGVDASLKVYNGMGHGFNYGALGRLPKAMDSFETVSAFIENRFSM